VAYFSIKYTHIFLALVSISFFTIRAVWAITGSDFLHMRWVKVAPHIIDTLLFSCGLYLAIITQPLPLQLWLSVKLLALLLYILLGMATIKWCKHTAGRTFSALLALLTFGFMVGVALTKDPMFWLSSLG
jgi:uncharacterized membrane protein SirB2